MDHDLGNRKKRLKFRAWHRGIKEVDLVLGPFADAHLEGMGEAEVEDFETLCAIPDQDIFDWLCERRTLSGSYRTKLHEQIFDFSRRTRRV